MRVLVVLLAACGTSPPPPPVPPPPPQPVRIEIAATPCIDVVAARLRFDEVLTARHATHADLVIHVDAAPAPNGTELQLRVTRSSTGHTGLDRRYALGPADCASAPELLALGIDRFLDAFPDWRGPPPPPKPPAPIPTRWLDVALHGAASSMLGPLGVDAYLGAAIDYGAAGHRAGGSLLVRGSLPQGAGTGSFQQTSFLAGAVYRYRTGNWRLRTEARAGALLVSGIGLTENRSDWLPWWEGAVFAGRGFSWGALGVEIAASGLQHHAVTSDGLVREAIPLLRLGFAGELGVWSSKP